MAELEFSRIEPNTVVDPAVSAAPPLSNETMNQRMGDIEFRMELGETNPLATLALEGIREKTAETGGYYQYIKYLMGNPETGEVLGDDPEDPIYGTTDRGFIRGSTLEGLHDIRVNATDRVDRFGEKWAKRGEYDRLRQAQYEDGGDQVLAHELAHLALGDLWDQGEAPELKDIFEEDVVEVMDSLRYADMQGDVDPRSSWRPKKTMYEKEPERERKRANYPAVAMAILTQGHDQFDGIISLSPYERQLADLVVKVNKAAARKLTEKGIRTEFPTPLSSNSLSAIDKYMTNYRNHRKSTQMMDPNTVYTGPGAQTENTVYTDPRARAAILMGEQTPEKEEIASKIMNEGLPQAMESLSQPSGIQTVQAAPPSGNGEVDGGVEGLLEQGLGPEESARQKAFAERQSISNWLLINEKEPVPWAEDLTWGQHIDSILTMKGPVEGRKAVEQIILQQIKQEEEKGSQPEGGEVRNLPTIPAPQGLQVHAGAPGAPPQGLQVPAGAPGAPPQGIMAAAEGGLVPPTAGGPVGEEEFMQTLQNMAQEAGVDPGAMETVAQNIGAPANDNAMDSGIMQNVGAPANDNTLNNGIMQTVEAVEATPSELSGIGSLVEISERLENAGKEPLIHATPGEIVFDPNVLPEKERRMLFAALNAAGIDPARVTVGNDLMELNELTGLPAAGFGGVFKKVGRAVKKVGKFLKKNASTILGTAGAMTGQPWLAALGSGIGKLIEGEGIKSALLSAAMSYASSEWVGPWIGEKISGVAGSLGTTSLGEALGAVTPNAMGGHYLATKGAEEVAKKAALDTAGQAAANAVLTNTGKNLTSAQIQKAAANAALESMQKTIVGAGTGAVGPAAYTLASTLGSDGATIMADNLARSAIEQTAGTTFSRGISTASQFVVDGPGLGTLIGTAPSYAVSGPIQQFLGTPVSKALGTAAAGAAQAYSEPMLAQMLVPPDQKGDILDAWNARYNYTPSDQELYKFYKDEYSPNRQVDVPGIIGGLPGYPLSVAGGGYINGVGGPKSDSNLARLSDGEFVMTEAAVRGAGNGDRARGAERMYGIMSNLERRAA